MIHADDEVELIAKLLCGATAYVPVRAPEDIEWPPKGARTTLIRYVKRAQVIRDGLKERGWTSP